MNTHIDIHGISAATAKHGNKLTWLAVESGDGCTELNLWLTREDADRLRAGLEELYPTTTDGVERPVEPFVVDEERDAAPTLRPSDLRPVGISACSATFDND